MTYRDRIKGTTRLGVKRLDRTSLIFDPDGLSEVLCGGDKRSHLRMILMYEATEPEFEERSGEVVVRFLPSGYIPPLRVSHNLTDRQRQLLEILSNGAK